MYVCVYIYIYIHTHIHTYTHTHTYMSMYVCRPTNMRFFLRPTIRFPRVINPLNVELNPICHLLALLGAHHILHISRIKVNAIKCKLQRFLCVWRNSKQVELK
jgi:hypothetical protein